MAWTYNNSDIPKIPGIYMWYNKINGKKYVGSGKNLRDRKRTHLTNLRNNKNACGCLQAAYNKYGEDSLLFIVLFKCDIDSLLKFEQYFIDNLHPEYNKRKIANSNLGLKMSEETKEKHRARGKKIYPREMIEVCKTNHYLKGKHRSPETIEKLRIASTGRKVSIEARAKISAFHKGKVHQCKSLSGKLLSPDGTMYENIINLEKFGREHGIDKRRMSEFSTGKRTSWGGWTYVAI